MAKSSHQVFLERAEQAIQNQKKESGTETQDPLFSFHSHSDMDGIPQNNGRLNIALRRAIENLDEELERFEKNFSSVTNHICWAQNYEDVFAQLRSVFKQQKISAVSMADNIKSSIFEEMGLSFFLNDEKVPFSDNNAQLHFFAADLLISETGSVLLKYKDSKYLNLLNDKNDNVIFASINQVMSAVNNVDAYCRLFPDDDKNTYSQIMFRGSANCNTYLFIIDNQRTDVLSHKIQRQALICTNCSKCESVCPIDKVIGKAPYDNVFTGPIARVMLPFLEDEEEYRHVVFACTLCGRCEKVCPLELPIRNMILASRKEFYKNDLLDSFQEKMIAKFKKYVCDRDKMNKPAWLKQRVLSKYLTDDFKESRTLPKFEEKTFNQQFGIKK